MLLSVSTVMCFYHKTLQHLNENAIVGAAPFCFYFLWVFVSPHKHQIEIQANQIERHL